MKSVRDIARCFCVFEKGTERERRKVVVQHISFSARLDLLRLDSRESTQCGRVLFFFVVVESETDKFIRCKTFFSMTSACVVIIHKKGILSLLLRFETSRSLLLLRNIAETTSLFGFFFKKRPCLRDVARENR